MSPHTKAHQIGDGLIHLSDTLENLNNLLDRTLSDQFVSCSGAFRSSYVQNRYLNWVGYMPMNLAPFVMPFDGEVIAMSLATYTARTWILQLRLNNSSVISELSSGGLNTAYDDTYTNANVDAGSRLSLFCFTSGGNRAYYPSGTVVFRKR